MNNNGLNLDENAWVTEDVIRQAAVDEEMVGVSAQTANRQWVGKVEGENTESWVTAQGEKPADGAVIDEGSRFPVTEEEWLKLMECADTENLPLKEQLDDIVKGESRVDAALKVCEKQAEKKEESCKILRKMMGKLLEREDCPAFIKAVSTPSCGNSSRRAQRKKKTSRKGRTKKSCRSGKC